jgi:hypothetical protein
MIVLPRGRCELLEEGQGHVADSGRTGPHEFPRLDHTSENVEEKHLDDNRETEESGFYDLDAYVEKLRCEKEKFGFDWDTYLKTFLNGNSEWPAEFDRICEAATLSTPEEVGNFARTKMSASGIKSFRQNGRIESLKAKDFARMDPEEKQFTTSFTKICAIKRHLNAFDAFFKTLGPGCTLEMLRPEKRLKLDAEIERFVTRSAELRDQAFYRKNGCSIQTASGLLPTNHKMQFFPEDFNVSSFLHGKSGVEMNIASLCGSRESKLKVFKRVNRSFNIYDKLKLYLAAANKLKKGIDDLTEEEFTVIEGKLREEQTRMATKKADQAYQELMRREEAHQKSARAQVHAQN